MITLDMESIGNYMFLIISSLWNSCNEVYLEMAFITFLTLSLSTTIYIMWKRNNSAPVEGTVSSENAPFNSDCPVCLDELTDGAESNCGHLFCGSCLKQLIERRSFRRLFICPVCRQKVHLLYEYFPNGSSDENAELRSDITNYNNFSLLTFPQNVWDTVQSMPTLLRHLFQRIMENGFQFDQLLSTVLLFGGISLVYFLLPTDILPELVFGVYGLIDDFIVVFYCLFQLSIFYRNFLANTPVL